MDRIAVDAALAGSDAGFDGRKLQVGHRPCSLEWPDAGHATRQIRRSLSTGALSRHSYCTSIRLLRHLVHNGLCRAQVRSAGEDAWLGRRAPEDPALDCVAEAPGSSTMATASAFPSVLKHGALDNASSSNGALTQGR